MTPTLAAATSPVTSARVAAWTWSEARRLAGSLPGEGMGAVDTITPPPPAGARHRTTVEAVLRLAGATCLVRSAVLQCWDAAHDRARPLVVGVARDADGVLAAHAWLDGDADGAGYVVLHRRPPT